MGVVMGKYLEKVFFGCFGLEIERQEGIPLGTRAAGAADLRCETSDEYSCQARGNKNRES
jgi:hypothetical protein